MIAGRKAVTREPNDLGVALARAALSQYNIAGRCEDYVNPGGGTSGGPQIACGALD